MPHPLGIMAACLVVSLLIGMALFGGLLLLSF